MAQKVHPRSLRTGIWSGSANAWFAQQRFRSLWGRTLVLQHWAQELCTNLHRYGGKLAGKRQVKASTVSAVTGTFVKAGPYMFSVSPIAAVKALTGLQWKYHPVQKIRKRNRNTIAKKYNKKFSKNFR